MLENWKTFKLIELYDISSGLSKSADEFGFGFPFLSFSTVFKNYFIPNELDQLVNTSIKEQATCSVKKGDVFLTRTSETIEELGMSCVALKNYPNATFNGFTKRLRPKNDLEIDPLFIGYYLRNVQFRGEISAYSTLTTRASLNNGIIEKLKVTVPALPNQQKIASILSSYDDLIENNKQRIKLLEEMAEEIYQEWFVRLRFPGYENTKIVDGLPEGWERVKLDDVLETVKRKPKISTDLYLSNGKFPIIDQGNEFIAGYTNDESSVQYEPLPLLVFGDHTRRVKFVNYPFASGADGTQLLSPKNKKLLPIYFYISVKGIDLSNFHYARHFKFLKQEYITIPDDKTLLKFNNLASPFYDEIQILKDKNLLLQETRDLLLPRLISGKLSVAHLVEKEELTVVAQKVED